jgi:hypothetical protein
MPVMEIDFLILADAAQVADGKLYILGGGWDRINVQALPAGQLLGVGVGVTVPWSETNAPQNLTVSIEDEDGGVVLPPLSFRIEVGRPPGLPGGSDQRLVLAFNGHIALPKLGMYAVTAALDGGGRRQAFFTVQQGQGFQSMLPPGT